MNEVHDYLSEEEKENNVDIFNDITNRLIHDIVLLENMSKEDKGLIIDALRLVAKEEIGVIHLTNIKYVNEFIESDLGLLHLLLSHRLNLLKDANYWDVINGLNTISKEIESENDLLIRYIQFYYYSERLRNIVDRSIFLTEIKFEDQMKIYSICLYMKEVLFKGNLTELSKMTMNRVDVLLESLKVYGEYSIVLIEKKSKALLKRFEYK